MQIQQAISFVYTSYTDFQGAIFQGSHIILQ